MTVFIYLLAVVWAIRIIANLLSYIHLWFVKEYRFDRMLIHLHTNQGKRLLVLPWRLPPLSPKTVAIAAGSLLVLVLLVGWAPFPLLAKLAMIDLATFPITALFVFLFNLPTLLYHALLIRRAVRKLRNHKPMLVIGITGSYGKTSTKEYLAAILSSQFHVLKTPASKNSPIGIAETLLRQLRPEHQIFVVEMGAYKRGEIAKMTAMVQPQIGVVTAINAQHQDLFRTIQTTKLAKYELIQGLSGQALGIFNADNAAVRDMAQWAKRDGRRVWSFTRENAKPGARVERAFAAYDIQADMGGVRFKVTDGEEVFPVKAPVLGEHQVSNLLGAMVAAVAAGMKLSAAAAGCLRVKPVKKVLEVVPGVGGSTFINDTFNNNPDAAKAALAVLAKTTGRKFLVFQPMIELGSFAAAAHTEVGELAGRICDGIILTNDNFSRHFLAGAVQSRAGKKVQILPRGKAQAYLRSLLKKGDTVLFKGKEAEAVLEALVS